MFKGVFSTFVTEIYTVSLVYKAYRLFSDKFFNPFAKLIIASDVTKYNVIIDRYLLSPGFGRLGNLSIRETRNGKNIPVLFL